MFMSGNERKLRKELKKLKSELIAVRNEKLADIDDSTFDENGEKLPATEVKNEDKE